jgi:hypothetical protein
MPLLDTEKVSVILEELVHATNEDRFIWHTSGGEPEVFNLNLERAEASFSVDDSFHILSRGGWEMGRVTVQDHGGALVSMLREAIEARRNRFLRDLCKQIEKL